MMFLIDRSLFMICVLFLLEIAKQVGPISSNNKENESNTSNSGSGDDDTSGEIPEEQLRVRKDYIIMMEEDESANKKSESNQLLALLRGLERRGKDKQLNVKYAGNDDNDIEPFYGNNDESNYYGRRNNDASNYYNHRNNDDFNYYGRRNNDESNYYGTGHRNNDASDYYNHRNNDDFNYYSRRNNDESNYYGRRNNDKYIYEDDSDDEYGSKGKLIGDNVYRNFLEEDNDRGEDVGQGRFVDEPMDNYDDQTGGNYAPAVYDYDEDNMRDNDRGEVGYSRGTSPLSSDSANDGRTIILEEDDDRKRRTNVM